MPLYGLCDSLRLGVKRSRLGRQWRSRRADRILGSKILLVVISDMPWKLPRPRFGLRALLLLVLACGIGLAFWTSPGRWRTYRNQQARQRIDPYELSIAGDGNSHNVPPELLAILGDSRLKHWGYVGPLRILSGNRLASHGRDEKLRIWDIETGRQKLAIDALSFTVSGDRKVLFFATADGTIKRTAVNSLQIVGSLPAITGFERFNLAASKDGTILVSEASKADMTREITTWDVAQSRAMNTFRPPKPGGGALALSSDGKLFTWEDGGQFHISETATGKVLQTCGPIRDESSAGGRYALGNVAFSADDTRLYAGSARREVVVFDRQTGDEIERIGMTSSGLHVFALGAGERFLFAPSDEYLRVFRRSASTWEHSGDLTAMRPDLSQVDYANAVIAASHREGGITLWAESLGPPIPWRLASGPEMDVRCLAFHPSGWLATGSSNGQVSCWKRDNWHLLRQWRAHHGVIHSIGISLNGAKLASAGDDGIAVWDEETLNETVTVRQFMFSPLVGLSPDGKRVVTGMQAVQGDVMEVSDADKGTSIAKLGSLSSSIYSTPAWSPDGKLLVCNDMSSTLHAFDMDAYKLIGTLGKSRFASCQVRAVWMSDSKRLITAGWGKDEVHLLEIGKTTPVMTINAGGGQVKWVALHPSEKWFATCGTNTPVEIWHLPTQKLVKSWQIGPVKGTVSQVEFSPDGHYLATVNGNGTAYILSLDGVLKE